jgi:predicted lipoprotein
MKHSMLFLLSLFLVFVSCTVVRHNENKKSRDGVAIYFDNGTFDAKGFVGERWDTEIIPAIEGKAIDADKLLGMMKEDPEKASSGPWAFRIDETAPVNYIVTGIGKITAVNTASAAGTIEVQLAAGNIFIQIGPVIKYTSIRDSMDFIRFQDFTNQLEYANVSKEINIVVRDKVLGDLDRTGLKGKSIRFMGCFTDNQEQIILTPAFIELCPEDL